MQMLTTTTGDEWYAVGRVSTSITANLSYAGKRFRWHRQDIVRLRHDCACHGGGTLFRSTEAEQLLMRHLDVGPRPCEGSAYEDYERSRTSRVSFAIMLLGINLYIAQVFGGAPLDQNVGDTLASHGINLYSLYGR